MTSRKTQKTKTKMALLALPFFDFSVFSKLFGGPLNSDYILAILLVFLAFFSLWFVLIFFQKIRKASPRLFYFLSLALILGGFAYGTDRFIQRELDFEESGIQIPKRIGNSAVLGESDSEIREESANSGIFEGANLEEFLTIAGISQNEKGDPRGVLQVRNERIKIKAGRVSSRAIKDGTIRDEDIYDNIRLHVKDIFVSRNIEVGGSATFQNGASISGGNLTVSGNIAAGTVNGNTITTGTGTLTLDSFTLALSGNSEINQNLLTTSSPTFASLNTGQGAYELYAMDQDVLTTSAPTFSDLTLSGNLNFSGTDPIINLSTASTLNINTTNNRPVTFGTGLVTIPNLSISDSGVDYGTMTIDSDETTGSILTVTGGYLTSGTGILKNITANAGNGQITTGEKVVLTDATVNGGGYTGISVTVSGSGTGSGNKYLLDLNPGTNMQVVFDSSGAFRPTTAVSSNTNTIGSPSFYWKNGYFDQVTANNLSGTVVTGATSSTTWTIGSTETGDVNEALIFQRNSGSGNATLEWRRGTNDLRYLSVNYPFNSTYTVDDSSIGTGINLYSGNLTNNTTSGTQRLLSLTNTGTGTTETGIYLSNTGTATTAIEIAGTWTNGIVTNNNSINTGTGTITGASYNGLGLTSNADGFSITGGVIPRTLSVTGEEITLIATSPTSITLPITGTIATLAGAETFTNKVSYNGLVITANTGVITTGTWNGTSIADAYIDDNITLSNLTQLTTRSHADLQNLLVDDHTQYALLAGRASGQTLIGGTGTTDDLIFRTTAGVGASGADMIFQTGNNGGTEAVRILYDGKVGIGTAAPESKLDVRGDLLIKESVYGVDRSLIIDVRDNDYDSIISFRRAGLADTARIFVNHNDGTGTANSLQFATGLGAPTTKMMITNGGNVGIGTTSPTYKLHVNGTLGLESTIYAPNIGAGTDNSVLVLNSSGNVVTDEIDPDVWTPGSLLDGNGTANYVPYYSDADTLAISNIYYNGTNVGIGTTSPGQKLEIIGDIAVSSALRTNAIRPYTTGTAYFKNNGGSNIGEFAQDGTNLFNWYYGANLATISGNVGIGTTSPQAKLHVSGGEIHIDNNQLLAFRNAAGTGVAADIVSSASNDLRLRTGSNERITILSGGNVGIGTTTPGSTLEIIGNTEGFIETDTDSSYREFKLTHYDATDTYTNTNSILGEFSFYGEVGSSDQKMASIRSSVTSVSGSLGSNLQFFTKDTGDSSPVVRMTIDKEGDVGIGTTTTSTGKLSVSRSLANTDFGVSGYIHNNDDISTTGTYREKSLLVVNYVNASGDQTADNLSGYHRGIEINNYLRENAGTIGTMTGLHIESGSYGPSAADVSATITNNYGIRIAGQKMASTTINNAYGLYVGGMAGTNVWDIYASDATANNYFAGNVGIGATAPSAKLYVDQTAASNLVDFLDGGTSIFQIADGGLISMHGSITYNSAAKPKRSIILTSSGATIPTSGGATQTKVDGANHTYYVLDFGDATDSSSFWQWTMPDSYDGGTIDVTFYWEAAATTGDVVWAAQTAGVDPDNTEDVDPTLGSAQTVTDTAQGNANDLASATISSWSPSWAAGDYIVFKAYRDADAGGDTLSGNARLVKVKVEYSVSSESD